MRRSRLFIRKQQQQILTLLEKQERISVEALSAELCLSTATIRRYLNGLVSEGVVRRFHGGVVLARSNRPETPLFGEKSAVMQREKQLIAAAVSDLIPEKATVCLNAGSTTLEIIRKLNNRHVRIITNNAMASSVITSTEAELISTGGEYSTATRAYTGEFAVVALGKVFADICVLGANGVCAATGVTSSVYKETSLNELLVSRCENHCIVAADGSKIGKTHCFTSVPLSRVRTLVTDSSADAEELQRIREAGVQVILADVAER